MLLTPGLIVIKGISCLPCEIILVITPAFPFGKVLWDTVFYLALQEFINDIRRASLFSMSRFISGSG